MDNFFNDIFNALSGEDFEEQPVEIEEFVQSEEFLGLPPLSEVQYTIIRAGSQIYKYETLVALYGEEKAQKRWEQTCNEVILQLGKGSGKDYTSTIVCSYIVYLLMCLKDPAKYYGKPSGDTIDIVNIAVNADQAKNVFFANFVKRIKSCKWFANKYHDTNNSIEFDKSIRVFSGHSEREAFEGLNLFVAVLDEISAFALESASGSQQAKTADAVYKMYRASVDSRFPDYGKVIMLSFPRFKDDYIQQRYNAVIAENSTYTVRVLDMFDLVVLKQDRSLTPCLLNDGFWEAWISSWLTRWIRPGMTFVDVGANCGYYTMLAEKLVGRHGHVVAYEPNPVYAEMLRATRELNDADYNIREVALSDSVGQVTLSVPGQLHGSASIVHSFRDSEYGESSAYDVRTTTLDNELQRLVFWNADVVKVDAEGAEELVWNGGQNLFNADASHSTIMLEYTPGSYSPKFLEDLFEWGYVFNIEFDGGETPATREFINSLTDWSMLAIRRK